MGLLDLPDSGKDLVDAIDATMNPAEIECNLYKTVWKVVDAYLSGYRHFRISDRRAGNVDIAFEKMDGTLDLRYEQALKNYLIECGRLAKMDITPQVTRRGESIDALRQASIGHATVGALYRKLNSNKLKMSTIKPAVKYGTVGLHHSNTGDKDFPDLAEVVHPRELRGLNAWTDGVVNLRGIGRKRYVPLDYVKRSLQDRYGKKLKGSIQELRGIVVPWGGAVPGEPVVTVEGRIITPSGSGVDGTMTMKTDDLFDINEKHKKRDGVSESSGRVFVPLEEIFEYSEVGTDMSFIDRYIIKVGGVVPHDIRYEERELCPLSVVRYGDTDRFFGRGYVAPEIPFHDQIEKMLAALFQNVIDIDQLGALLLPVEWGVDLDLFKKGRRPKVGTYSPDINAPNHKEVHIAPVTSGAMPAQAANVGFQALDRLSGQSPIMSGQSVGRVESGSAYGFLFDAANIALALASHSLADGFVSIYGRMMQEAKKRYQREDFIDLAVVDDAVAGIIVDPETGKLSLMDNPIPSVWEVNIDIKDRTPRDLNARKQELYSLHQAQLVTTMDFWLANFKEHLDFPGAPQDIWETYRKTVWQIVLLFRDGKEPGEIVAGELNTNVDVALVTLQNFMNKIEFALASPEVREAFEGWKITLEEMQGKRYPEGLAPPEQLGQQPAGMGMGMPDMKSMGGMM